MFVINLKTLLIVLLDYIESKKFVSTVALFFLGMFFYTPYFINITYLPTLNEVSVFFIIFLLVIPIFFLFFIPIVIMAPAYVWDNLIKKDTELVNVLFKINNQNIDNVFLYVILPLYSIVMVITSSILKSYYLTILFSSVFFALMIRVFINLNNSKKFKRYFSTLLISGFFLFLVVISFLVGIEERLTSSSIYRTVPPMLIYGILIFIYVAFALGSLKRFQEENIKKWISYFFIGWFLLFLVVSFKNAIIKKENPILVVLSTPAKLTLSVLGRGAIQKDIILNQDFCVKSGVLPKKQDKCLPMNRYENIKILLDVGVVYAEFEDGLRIELDKKNYGYLEIVKDVDTENEKK